MPPQGSSFVFFPCLFVFFFLSFCISLFHLLKLPSVDRTKTIYILKDEGNRKLEIAQRRLKSKGKYYKCWKFKFELKSESYFGRCMWRKRNLARLLNFSAPLPLLQSFLLKEIHFPSFLHKKTDTFLMAFTPSSF